MEFLGRDTNLGAKAELAAIGKAGRGVHINRSGVHRTQEKLSGLIILGDDRFAMVGRVAVDVCHRLMHPVDKLDRNLGTEILRAPIGVSPSDKLLALRKARLRRSVASRLVAVDKDAPR